MKKKELRSGYTTGACAAAAAKAAAMLLMSSELGVQSLKRIPSVEIPFPDGSRVSFKVHNSKLITLNFKLIAYTSVIKDAGDDPDVTNGAEIVAEVKIRSKKLEAGSENSLNSHFLLPNSHLLIKGGKGVGIATKPGLPIPVGEPAINPVPRQMIKEAVMEAFANLPVRRTLEITISVTDGEMLAKKTLNSRLGIMGGISILGTTGIVKPLSSEAWTATITSSMDIAKAMGHKEIILSAGRASEKAHMKKYGLPEESYVMMGDYLEFSLLEAVRHKFKKIHLCAQWAKMLKIAMSMPQTHVRHGAIEIKKAVEFLNHIGINIPHGFAFNTARQIFDFIYSTFQDPHSEFINVCKAAKKYAGEIATGIPVISYLVSYEGDIIAING
jgi:cobalt-precorrin-5B (C1)-methyltransferase